MYLFNICQAFLAKFSGRTLVLAVGNFDHMAKLTNAAGVQSIRCVRYTFNGDPKIRSDFEMTKRIFSESSSPEACLSTKVGRVINDPSIARLVLHIDASVLNNDPDMLKALAECGRAKSEYLFKFTTGVNASGFTTVPYATWTRFFFRGFNTALDPGFVRVRRRMDAYASNRGVSAPERVYLNNLKTLVNLLGV